MSDKYFKDKYLGSDNIEYKSLFVPWDFKIGTNEYTKKLVESPEDMAEFINSSSVNESTREFMKRCQQIKAYGRRIIFINGRAFAKPKIGLDFNVAWWCVSCIMAIISLNSLIFFTLRDGWIDARVSGILMLVVWVANLFVYYGLIPEEN